MKHFTPIAAFLLLSLPIHSLASPETDLCQFSEYGQDICMQTLTAFLETNPEGPLSDDELYEVYGCLIETVSDQSIKTDHVLSICP